MLVCVFVAQLCDLTISLSRLVLLLVVGGKRFFQSSTELRHELVHLRRGLADALVQVEADVREVLVFAVQSRSVPSDVLCELLLEAAARVAEQRVQVGVRLGELLVKICARSREVFVVLLDQLVADFALLRKLRVQSGTHLGKVAIVLVDVAILRRELARELRVKTFTYLREVLLETLAGSLRFVDACSV